MGRIKEILKKPKSWILTLAYILIATLLDDGPEETLLYILPESLAMMLFAMLFELFQAKSFGKAVGRFFVYLIFIALTCFMLVFPLVFILFFNSTQLSELDLFHSETADQIYLILDIDSNYGSILPNMIDVMGFPGIIVFVLALSNFIFSKFKSGSMFKGNTSSVPYELKYVSFMTLGFLIGLLPAFIIGLIFYGSFPVVLIIIMRFYTEYSISED